jgi:hypothetical protein
MLLLEKKNERDFGNNFSPVAYWGVSGGCTPSSAAIPAVIRFLARSVRGWSAVACTDAARFGWQEQAQPTSFCFT